mgnify:CR=1 FL=1
MLYEALVEEIKRKAFIAKSMGQEFTDENYLEEIEKSMGRAQMGEVRTWGGKEYIKTPKGWRPKPKGYKDGRKKQTKNLPSDAMKVMDALLTSRSEYNDPSKVTVEATPKGNWRLYYDGEDTGTTISGGLLSDNTIEELGWEHHDAADEKEGKEESGKVNNRGGGKFELEVPGKGGAQISEGDGKFEVKVWDTDYKYLTDDSKRHVFDSKSEAERFARELLDKKGKEKKPKTIKDILDSKVVADFIKNELPKYNNNLDDDNQITERVLKDLIMDVHEQWSDKERTPLNGVFSGKSELTEKHLKKLVDFFWEDLVD